MTTGTKKKNSVSTILTKYDDLLERHNETLEEFYKSLDQDPQFDIHADPTGFYGMSSQEKLFIEFYCQYKSIPVATELAQMSSDEALSFFANYNTQSEIKRINRAYYQRQFGMKMLNLDQIGSYLTAQILDENVPIGQQLKPKEKLDALKMLIALNEYREKAIENPAIIINSEIDSYMKDLSPDSIKQLLADLNNESNPHDDDEKDEEIRTINKNNSQLSIEEIGELKTLPSEELKKVINQVKEIQEKPKKSKKGGTKDENIHQ